MTFEHHPSIESPFGVYRAITQEQSEARNGFLEWCRQLKEGEIPVDVSGFPTSVTMKLRDEETGEIVSNVSIPVYSLLEGEDRQPRSVTRGRVVGHSVNGNTIFISTSSNPDARIYNFSLHNIQKFEPSTDPEGRYVTYHAHEDGSYEINFESAE